MNVNLYFIENYENKTALSSQKTNPNKPNFKPGDGFSPQVRLGTPYGGVPGTAYYKRDCHGAEFNLSAAEGASQ